MASAAGKGSKSYKALFAIQKGFAVASATMNAILAWSQALSDPSQPSWIAKIGTIRKCNCLNCKHPFTAEIS
jgi:hypothetical protein